MNSTEIISEQLRDLVGLGAGGHARVLIDVVRKRGGTIYGFLVNPRDYAPGADTTFEGAPILGTDELLAELYDQGLRRAFIGLGTVRASPVRQKLAELCAEHGFELPALIDPDAIVSGSAQIDDGAQILPGAIVNAAGRVGRAAIINTGAIVEHDCRIGAFSHISPGARLGGGVQVGEGAHVGLGASVLQGVHVGEDATVGAGAVVLDDVPAGETAVGVPARLL